MCSTPTGLFRSVVGGIWSQSLESKGKQGKGRGCSKEGIFFSSCLPSKLPPFRLVSPSFLSQDPFLPPRIREYYSPLWTKRDEDQGNANASPILGADQWPSCQRDSSAGPQDSASNG